MSFPRYPAYKDSGMEWLGEVPEHWEVKRIASLYREVVEQGNEELPLLRRPWKTQAICGTMAL